MNGKFFGVPRVEPRVEPDSDVAGDDLIDLSIRSIVMLTNDVHAVHVHDVEISRCHVAEICRRVPDELYEDFMKKLFETFARELRDDPRVRFVIGKTARHVMMQRRMTPRPGRVPRGVDSQDLLVLSQGGYRRMGIFDDIDGKTIFMPLAKARTIPGLLERVKKDYVAYYYHVMDTDGNVYITTLSRFDSKPTLCPGDIVKFPETSIQKARGSEFIDSIVENPKIEYKIRLSDFLDGEQTPLKTYTSLANTDSFWEDVSTNGVPKLIYLKNMIVIGIGELRERADKRCGGMSEKTFIFKIIADSDYEGNVVLNCPYTVYTESFNRESPPVSPHDYVDILGCFRRRGESIYFCAYHVEKVSVEYEEPLSFDFISMRLRALDALAQNDNNSIYIENIEPIMINEYVELRAVNGRPIIFINGEEFMQCMFIATNITPQEGEVIDSIDELVKLEEPVVEQSNLEEPAIDLDILDGYSVIDDHVSMDAAREFERHPAVSMTLKEQMFAHASNLIGWVETGYNTRALDSRLSFPILIKLSKLGDEVAKRVLDAEITERLEKDFEPTSIAILDTCVEVMTIDDLKISLRSRHPKVRDLAEGIAKRRGLILTV